MKYKTRRIVWISFMMGLILCSQSGLLFSFNKKVRVIADNANIYLDPNKNSTIIATLDKGAILTLGSSRKFRRIWNYVYFTSKISGLTKSGYIINSLIEKLFRVTKVITIKGEVDEPQKKVGPKTHFRNTSWGMSRKKVLELQGNPIHQKKSQGLYIIEYQEKVMDMDCFIGYIFAENRLAGAEYSFLEQHRGKNQHINDYKRIKGLLIQKYGRPDKENATWRNTLYKGDVSQWGYAISLGHLEYSTQWINYETEILLRLSGGNDEISLKVDYTGVKVKNLVIRAEKKSLLDIL